MKTSSKNVNNLEHTVSVIGDKWTPLLINALADKAQSFCHLESSLEGISPRTLSARLDKLEVDKILKKSCYCEHPPRYQYSLTKKGQDLSRVLSSMTSWGAKYS